MKVMGKGPRETKQIKKEKSKDAAHYSNSTSQDAAMSSWDLRQLVWGCDGGVGVRKETRRASREKDEERQKRRRLSRRSSLQVMGAVTNGPKRPGKARATRGEGAIDKLYRITTSIDKRARAFCPRVEMEDKSERRESVFVSRLLS